MGQSSVRSAAQPTSHAAEGQRREAAADASPPNVWLLSNGRYSVVLTDAGSGYSSCDRLDVTRWREDATGDCWAGIATSVTSMATAPGRPVCSRSAETPTTTRRSSVRAGPSSGAAMRTSRRGTRSRSWPTRMPRSGGSR